MSFVGSKPQVCQKCGNHTTRTARLDQCSSVASKKSCHEVPSRVVSSNLDSGGGPSLETHVARKRLSDGHRVVEDRCMRRRSSVRRCSADIIAARRFARIRQVTGDQSTHENYPSFYGDSGKMTAAEIERIATKGPIELFQSWSEVRERWPNAVAGKVASCIKTSEDHTTKVRLIMVASSRVRRACGT